MENKLRTVLFKPSSFRDEEKEGFFHTWGISYMESSEFGFGQFTVAIIEGKDGLVYSTPTHLFRFTV